MSDRLRLRPVRGDQQYGKLKKQIKQKQIKGTLVTTLSDPSLVEELLYSSCKKRPSISLNDHKSKFKFQFGVKNKNKLGTRSQPLQKVSALRNQPKRVIINPIQEQNNPKQTTKRLLTPKETQQGNQPTVKGKGMLRSAAQQAEGVQVSQKTNQNTKSKHLNRPNTAHSPPKKHSQANVDQSLALPSPDSTAQPQQPAASEPKTRNMQTQKEVIHTQSSKYVQLQTLDALLSNSASAGEDVIVQQMDVVKNNSQTQNVKSRGQAYSYKAYYEQITSQVPEQKTKNTTIASARQSQGQTMENNLTGKRLRGLQTKSQQKKSQTSKQRPKDLVSEVREQDRVVPQQVNRVVADVSVSGSDNTMYRIVVNETSNGDQIVVTIPAPNGQNQPRKIPLISVKWSDGVSAGDFIQPGESPGQTMQPA